MNSPSRLRLPLWALLFVVALLFILCATSRGVSVYDEGLILEGAERVSHGAFPHRDFYANYGPAQFLVLASLFKLFGASVLVERAWDAIVRATASLLATRIALRTTGRKQALLAFVVCLTFLTAAGSPGYPVYPVLVLILASVACLLPVFNERSPRKGLISAGAAIGVATLFRYDAGFFSFVAEAAVLSAFAWCEHREEQKWPAVVAAVVPYAAGTAAVLVPAAAVYWIAGAARDFWFDIVYFQGHEYAGMRSLPLPLPHLTSILGLDKDRLFDLLIYFPIFVFVMAGAKWLSAPGSNAHSSLGRLPAADRSKAGKWPRILLGALSMSLAVEGAVRAGALHLVASIVLAILLFFCICGSLGSREDRLFALPIGLGTGAFCMLWAVTTLLGPGVVLKQNVSWLAGGQAWANPSVAPGSCWPSAGLERLSCFVIAPYRTAAIEYVEEHAGSGEQIFVGLGRHDKIFLNDVLFYFLAKRSPATKWYHFDPGLQTSEKIQREIVVELESVKPRFVVLETDWDATMEPNRSSVSSGVVLLDDYIRRQYENEITFGTIHVLTRIQP